MTKDWALTQEDFDTLLAWLDPDRGRAGNKYEDIRHSLIKIFSWRGCHDAEDLADEAINRVTQRVPELVATYRGNPALYFHGVAKKMLLEYGRRGHEPEALPASGEIEDTAAADAPVDSEREHEALEHCLRQLLAKDRELILLYYREEKQAKIDFRRILAERLNIEPNNLRVKVHRIRKALHKCIKKYLRSEMN
jgi:RNA polymerase sigma factor (sigma-70 family)